MFSLKTLYTTWESALREALEVTTVAYCDILMVNSDDIIIYILERAV